MSSTTKLNGVRLGRMMIAGANELASNKQLVDAMNVFPVPDGDTGTNMSLTVMAAAREAEKRLLTGGGYRKGGIRRSSERRKRELRRNYFSDFPWLCKGIGGLGGSRCAGAGCGGRAGSENSI